MLIRQNAIELPDLMEKTTERDLTFIIDIDTHKICEINEEVLTYCNNNSLIGKKLHDVIYINKEVSHNSSPAFFCGQWFLLEQETILWNEAPHIKTVLKKRDNVPTTKVIKSLKRMIGFLLHRIRSPLTGIQGYTEFIETQLGEQQDDKYITQVYKGIDQLFELLDELETLEEIPLKKVDVENHSANPEKIITQILTGYTKEQQKNITVALASDTVQNLHCNPGDLRRILSILIGNAVEHAPLSKHEITISQPSVNSIKVSHNGNSIPSSVTKNLFCPFVTTKAQKLGIGLTMATLYARRYKGGIFLTDNDPLREISFTFCLPPAPFSYNLS